MANSYFSILASLLIAGSASSLLVQNTYAANTLVISAVALGGQALHMWTTISLGGSTVRSGLTPLTFAGTTGAAYSVTVSNYGSIFFDHWKNGNTARTRTLTLNADTAITAHLRDTAPPLPPPPPVPDPDPDPSPIADLIPKTGVFVALYMWPGGTGDDQ